MNKEVWETHIRKTNTLTDKQQDSIQTQLNNISGDFGYSGYSRVSYAINKEKTNSPENLVLNIVKVEPVEGNVLDEYDRIMKLLGDSVF